MEGLKRFYLNMVAGFTILSQHKASAEMNNDGMSASNRVSREVDHYRTHFFNI